MLRKFNVNINGKDYIVKLEEIGVDGNAIQTQVVAPLQQQPTTPPPVPAQPEPSKEISKDGVTVSAPMPGNILKIMVNVGDKVSYNQGLVILEAMKMENEIVSPKDGVVKAIYVSEGSAIDVSKPIITIV